MYNLKVARVKNRITLITLKKGAVPSIFSESDDILNISECNINYTEPFCKQLFLEKMSILVI